MRSVFSLVAVLVVVFTASVVSAAGRDDALVRARQLYNEGKFEAAVTAAEEVRAQPARADSADLITARAFLERYRETRRPEYLVEARGRLRRLNSERLSSVEQLELVVGWGETLYLEESIGAAGELFESVLDRDDLDSAARERVLDWWASVVDRQASGRTGFERQNMYVRVRDRMRDELGLNPGSAAAAYWLAAAARSQGDLQGAWDAAHAGWVRAPLTPDRGLRLRNDLDDLMQRAIVPERARGLAQSPDMLRTEWEQFKERWSK